MAIEIKMFGEKWRIKIQEEWEIPNKEILEGLLKELIGFKDKYGRLLKK